MMPQDFTENGATSAHYPEPARPQQMAGVFPVLSTKEWVERMVPAGLVSMESAERLAFAEERELLVQALGGLPIAPWQEQWLEQALLARTRRPSPPDDPWRWEEIT